MIKDNAGLWAGAALLFFSCVILYQSLSLKYYTDFGPGPGLFPLWLSGILLILSVIYIWQSLKKEIFTFTKSFPDGRQLLNVFKVLFSVIFFMLIVNFTGFVVAGALLLLILFFGEYKWYFGIGISCCASILLFLLFKVVFSIPLPVNAFGW